MKVLKRSNGVTRLDELNSSTSVSYKDWNGKLPIRAALIVEDNDKNYSYIFTADGGVYAGNSDTVLRSVETLIDILNEDEETQYYGEIHKGLSKSGKEFFTIRFSA